MAYSPALRISLSLIFFAVIAGFFADLKIVSTEPWQEIGKLLAGWWWPSITDVEELSLALLNTLLIAIWSIALSAIIGFVLAFFYQQRWLRTLCTFLRSIHELFWALFFIQLFGLNAVTAIIAIALPYSAIFAKVYAEILEENPDPQPLLLTPDAKVINFFYRTWPSVAGHFWDYTKYRLECGLRASTLLGFLGLPTLGYHLHAWLAQGLYHQASAVLALFYLLIASVNWWYKKILVLPLLLIAPWVLPTQLHWHWPSVVQFFTVDIVPLPLRAGNHSVDLGEWFSPLFYQQLLPGLQQTLMLSIIALLFSGILGLLFFPLISQQFGTAWRRRGGHFLLVILRSTPEYLLAFIALIVLGPSLLPAIVALAIHNGALIGHLTGRYSSYLELRPDTVTGVNRYWYEVLPRSFNQFLAYLLYRWEVIVRESAVLGLLGIYTLGFYIDSAIEDFRFDKAVILIFATGLLNIVIDKTSQYCRGYLRSDQPPAAAITVR